MTPSIRLVTVWSGPPPPYLPLFFGTAAHNPTVEFVFVADTPAPGALPPNVRWVWRPFPDLLAGMGRRLGCDLGAATPYKLCDLKPALGVALGDVLEGADFWGHVDCDVVLGDLRAFVPAERLAAHDVLAFAGHGIVHGPLTLWRNREPVNRLYERADWRAVFEAPEYLGFDETGHRWNDALDRASVAERRARGETASMTDVVCEAVERGEVRFFDANHQLHALTRARTPRLALVWERGALTDTVWRRPLAYFHLLLAKGDAEREGVPYGYPPWRWDELPERFGITRDGVGPVDVAFRRAQAEARYRAARGRLSRAVRRRVPGLLRLTGRSAP